MTSVVLIESDYTSLDPFHDWDGPPQHSLGPSYSSPLMSGPWQHVMSCLDHD